MPYQFSSVLLLISWSLFWQKLLWCHSFFSDLFFGMNRGILKSLIISPIIICRYLFSGNIKYSVKLFSKNSKILADISGPSNWWDVSHKKWLFLLYKKNVCYVVMSLYSKIFLLLNSLCKEFASVFDTTDFEIYP